MSTRILAVAVALAVLLAAPLAAQDDKEKRLPESVEKAQRQVQQDLAKINARNAQVIWVDAAPVRQLFPKDNFFAVRFRQFPVAVENPPGFDASNVVVVPEGKEGKRLPDKALRAYFREHVTAKDTKAAKAAVQAWLALAQEFVQDGFFKFEVLAKEAEAEEIPGGGIKATGRAMVTQGGNGDIKVTMVFDAEGKLAKVEQRAEIRPGPRPICQATKLLDADPIVRKMAEQDLLIMGVAARDYLTEQRAKAGPELRQAIDRLWQRIAARGH
jgi:hypothetical protein